MSVQLFVLTLAPYQQHFVSLQDLSSALLGQVEKSQEGSKCWANCGSLRQPFRGVRPLSMTVNLEEAFIETRISSPDSQGF